MLTDEIRLGTVTTLIGPFMEMGNDGMRGLELAVAEVDGRVAGKKITVFKEGSNAIPQSAIDATSSLLDRKHVDFVIGPLSGNEGLAVRDYAKIRPERVFINGIAGGQDMTLRDPAPNFFSFISNGVQTMCGFGSYVYNVKGFRRVATLAEDYSFPHAQVGGFMIDFYRAGGVVVQKFWVPLGTTDYSGIIEALPNDIDAIFVALGGTDAISFLRQYEAAGKATPLVGGTLTVDQTVLNVRGALTEHLIGMPTSGPTADDNPDPAWQAFAAAYRARYPRGLRSPSIAAWGYYVNTKAALLALEQVDGDLSNGQERFRNALSALEFESPTGHVRLDHNRNAIATNFITEIVRNSDGSLSNKLIQVVPNVNQTLGLPEADYLRLGTLNRDNPSAESSMANPMYALVRQGAV